MKKLTIIGMIIIVTSMILIAGCTDTEAVSATQCDRCSTNLTEKTSVITLVKNDALSMSKDGVRLHVKDTDCILYNTDPIASMMYDLDKYDGQNVTFTYRCNDDGFYQITMIDFANKPCCAPCNTPTQEPTKCPCKSSPTPKPTCGCNG